MKIFFAFLLTALGAFSAPDTPELFQKADKAYKAGKLALSERHSGETAEEKRQLFQTAKELFQQFISENPDHPETPSAYYRSGVCDLLTGKRSSAEKAFQNTLKASKNSGQNAASAAFRLGALTYNDKRFADAVPYFLISKAESDKPDLKAKSLLNLARCYLNTKQIKEAQTSLEELIALEFEDTTVREQAQATLKNLEATKSEKQ
ncbi:MAG: tetratricopeptide repeat protein [Roseibacillus sp.]